MSTQSTLAIKTTSEIDVSNVKLDAALGSRLLDIAAAGGELDTALSHAVMEIHKACGEADCGYFARIGETDIPTVAAGDGFAESVAEAVADLSIESRGADADNSLARNLGGGNWLFATPRALDAEITGVLAVRLPEALANSAQAQGVLRTCATFLQFMVETFAQRSALEEATARFESLSSSIPGVIYQRVVRSEDDIRYTYISETASEFFGVSAHEILTNPKALFNSYSPEYAAIFKKRLIEASKTLSTWDVEASLMMPDGSRRFTHAIAKPQKQSDGSVLWTGVILDASRIKEAERQAAETEARTRATIVEALGQGFLMFDHNDELILSNRHYGSLYPQLDGELREGMSYTELLRAEIGATFVEGMDQAVLDGRFRERHKAHVSHEASVFESRLTDNRWVQINEHRTDDGMTVVIHTDVSEIRQREERIHHMALHDALTGLPNRVFLSRRLELSVEEARRFETRVAVLCIDLDNFKTVNDTLGHPAGDKLLCEAARRIKKSLRGLDTLARLGGDEFAIVLHGDASVGRVTSIATRIIASIAEPFDLEGQRVLVGASIGIAFGDGNVDNPTDLMKNADLALYRTKGDGKNGFRFFEPEMNEQAMARRQLELDLRQALEEDELELYFQPQVNANGRVLSGFEALVRWRHPERGIVPPIEFIGMAEETGLIIPIGDWVLKTACEVAGKWPGDLRVAVNVSPMQFKRRGLVEFVASTLERTGLPPHRLELEITESVLRQVLGYSFGALHAIKALGVRIAMDDFGTGYSSLGNLRSFPFDRIKIDKSFVSDLTASGSSIADAAAIVRAVAGLGVSLGIDTTAEGVETTEQLDRVMAEGCSHVQGYLYGRPVPMAEVDGVIDSFVEHKPLD